jgi:RNA polymerase sigma-70 factor, ECF subfamily
MTIVSDNELVRRLSKGDQLAFKDLYLKFHARIYNFCFKLLASSEEAKDIVQHVFITLWDQRETLDAEKSIEKYIYTIARYSAYQNLRKRVYQHAAIVYLINNEPQLKEVTFDDVLYDELKGFFEEVIESLPARRKEIFKLNRNEGLTYKDIALRLNISENTVDTQMRHSLQFIKKAYDKYYN